MANKHNPETPAKIFAAASKLFAAYSYEAVSVKDIAEMGEVNSALISYYFGGNPGCTRACSYDRQIFS